MGGTIGGVVFFVLVVCGVCVCCSANDNLGAQVKRQQHPGSVLVGGPWEDVTAQGVATENPLQHAIHPVAVPAHHSGAWSARDMMMDDEGRVWVRPGGGGAMPAGAGVPPPPPVAAPGWVLIAGSDGAPSYYANAATGESSWTLPMFR